MMVAMMRKHRETHMGNGLKNTGFSTTAQGENGRPQGGVRFVAPAHGEPDGRPQGGVRFVAPAHGESDGRPQGAAPHIHPTPVPTMSGSVQMRGRHIVGTGVVGLRGGVPCGRPSSNIDEDVAWWRPSSHSRGVVARGRLSIASMLLLILVFSLSLVCFPLPTHAATTNNGHIYGQVLDGSKNNTPLAGQNVTLQMAQNGMAQDVKSMKTDGQGHFSFTGLATDKGLNYSVYLQYQGAQYNTKLLDLSTKAAQQVNLMVYDATTSTKKIAVLSVSILLHAPDAQNGIVSVSELYVFNNLDNHTYVGSLNAGSGMPDALRFSLPHTARNVSLSSGFDGYSSVQVDRGFASNAAVPPGISQFAFTFDMPYSESSYDFDYLVVYPTVQLSLYVPTELHASSDTLASQGIVTADSRPYQLLHATTLSANKEVHAQLEGLPVTTPTVGPSSSSNTNTLWLVVVLIVMALILLFTWAIYRARHRRPSVSASKNNGKAQARPDKEKKSAPVATATTKRTEQDISERKKELLQKLLDLDTDYEAGKLSKAVYEERRAKTKAKLRTLMANESEPAQRNM